MTHVNFRKWPCQPEFKGQEPQWVNGVWGPDVSRDNRLTFEIVSQMHLLKAQKEIGLWGPLMLGRGDPMLPVKF